jgi:indolepyruvate ferredoxin oxidoreductase
MNAPLPEHIRKALETVSLDDKYALEHGRAFMSGVQALVRLPMLQRTRDALAGKNTAGFISGYRGSPLGGYDQALVKAAKYLKAQNIVFQPGVNEELAATALWGTQQLGFAPPGTNKFDGVFGIWYGKGPGVDRCSDVFKHANMAGTTPWGGVIAVAGDDHVAKSSTAAHQSDHIFKACGLPVFFPADVQEILDMGIHAFAMSRFSGVWAGMKTIQEIVESSATAVIDPHRVQIVHPDRLRDAPRWRAYPLARPCAGPGGTAVRLQVVRRAGLYPGQPAELQRDRRPERPLWVIASGKAFNDTRQALLDLGLDDATCRQIGIRLHKVGVVWPLDAQTTREFATGLQEILVVEEKRQVIEYQLKEELYNWRADVRPNVYGKFNEVEGDFSGGEWSMPNPTANTLLRANADLSPAMIARAIAQRVKRMPLDGDMRARIDAQLAILQAKERAMQVLALGAAPGADRAPWFCSGCPHNTSTKVPEGSRAMAGIGCHFMAIWMDRSTLGFTQMGGEGVPWVGQQPFTTDQHMFANLGDGTYFHSGLLAIRQSIAAGVNITYKILYNDAVAMTGGQQVGERPEGHSVAQIAQSMRAEGAVQIVVVTDEPEKYAGVKLVEGVAVQHRDQLDAIQRAVPRDQGHHGHHLRPDLRHREAPPAQARQSGRPGQAGGHQRAGVRGLRRLQRAVQLPERRAAGDRVRPQAPDQPVHLQQGHVLPEGFLPEFCHRRRRAAAQEGARQGAVPVRRSAGAARAGPGLEPLAAGHAWGIVVAGVGGTGVITIGQLLGVAAHMEGKGIVTQDAGGLAQKGGATWSHVLIAPTQEDIRTTRVGMAGADLVIGCDPIVSAGKETMLRMREGRTHVALNSNSTPTAAFVRNANWQNPAEACAARDRNGGRGARPWPASTPMRPPPSCWVTASTPTR